MSQLEPITSKLTVLGKVILLLLVTQITVVWGSIRLVVQYYRYWDTHHEKSILMVMERMISCAKKNMLMGSETLKYIILMGIVLTLLLLLPSGHGLVYPVLLVALT